MLIRISNKCFILVLISAALWVSFFISSWATKSCSEFCHVGFFTYLSAANRSIAKSPNDMTKVPIKSEKLSVCNKFIFILFRSFSFMTLHSILLGLTSSCTLILASSNIELIADCQWDFTCWELIEDGFLQFAVFAYYVAVVRTKHVVDIKVINVKYWLSHSTNRYWV